ncbi:MAG: hypothetical protein R3E79_29885 [Caldilineaceae bacterium]
MWRIEYDRSVRNYIYDSYPYTEKIWQTIKSLRHTDSGIPDSDVRQLEADVFLWTVEEHEVIYRRLHAERILRFLVLKPK